jgi:hypothetical protein
MLLLVGSSTDTANVFLILFTDHRHWTPHNNWYLNRKNHRYKSRKELPNSIPHGLERDPAQHVSPPGTCVVDGVLVGGRPTVRVVVIGPALTQLDMLGPMVLKVMSVCLRKILTTICSYLCHSSMYCWWWKSNSFTLHWLTQLNLQCYSLHIRDTKDSTCKSYNYEHTYAAQLKWTGMEDVWVALTRMAISPLNGGDTPLCSRK